MPWTGFDGGVLGHGALHMALDAGLECDARCGAPLHINRMPDLPGHTEIDTKQN